jgi:hypothetical protein
LPHRRDLSVQGTYVDDPAVTLSGHNRDSRRCTIKASTEIRLDHLTKLVVSHRGKQAVSGDAGIVHQDVQVTKLFGNSLNHRPGFCGISDIRFVDDSGPTEFFDFFS